MCPAKKQRSTVTKVKSKQISSAKARIGKKK